MKIDKKEMKFLKEYVSVVDTSTEIGDKLRIKVKDGQVTYAQNSSEATLITQMSISTNEDFELLVNTKMFYDFINTLDDKDDLIITENGISLGDDKNYTFESYNLNFPNVDNLLDELKKEDQSPNMLFVDFKLFEEAAKVSKYMGKDSLETLGFMNGRIISTDRMRIAYCDSDLDLPKNYFISKRALNLIQAQKDQKELRIFFGDKYYFFKSGNTYCIFNYIEYTIPKNMFEEIYVNFNQEDFIKFNRTELNSVLTRMNFFVNDNPNNRVFLKVLEDGINIENKDFNKSYEKVHSLEMSNTALVDVTMVLSCKHIQEFVNQLSGDEIYMYINIDSNLQKTIRFEDKDHKYKFVLTRLKQEA